MSGGSALTISGGLLRLEQAPSLAPPGTQGIVFLDRDGVLNGLVEDPLSGMHESPLDARSVRLLPGVPEALDRLVTLGLLPVCVTNQPAAAKGTASVAQLLAVHERLIELLREQGAALAASYMCLHHPRGVIPALSGVCLCRKPSPGMLSAAAVAFGLELGHSWMVGDTDADMRAAAAAGCKTALVLDPGSFHKRGGRFGADLMCGSLGEVVRRLCSTSGKKGCQSNSVMVSRHQEGHHDRSDFYPDFRRRRRP